MAATGSDPHRSGDVAAALGKKTTQVGPVRRSLIQRGLCYSPRHDVIAFTVPMFDEFIRRKIAKSTSRLRAAAKRRSAYQRTSDDAVTVAGSTVEIGRCPKTLRRTDGDRSRTRDS